MRQTERKHSVVALGIASPLRRSSMAIHVWEIVVLANLCLARLCDAVAYHAVPCHTDQAEPSNALSRELNPCSAVVPESQIWHAMPSPAMLMGFASHLHYRCPFLAAGLCSVSTAQSGARTYAHPMTWHDIACEGMACQAKAPCESEYKQLEKDPVRAVQPCCTRIRELDV